MRQVRISATFAGVLAATVLFTGCGATPTESAQSTPPPEIVSAIRAAEEERRKGRDEELKLGQCQQQALDEMGPRDPAWDALMAQPPSPENTAAMKVLAEMQANATRQRIELCLSESGLSRDDFDNDGRYRGGSEGGGATVGFGTADGESPVTECDPIDRPDSARGDEYTAVSVVDGSCEVAHEVATAIEVDGPPSGWDCTGNTALTCTQGQVEVRLGLAHRSAGDGDTDVKNCGAVTAKLGEGGLVQRRRVSATVGVDCGEAFNVARTWLTDHMASSDVSINGWDCVSSSESCSSGDAQLILRPA